jgi:hypothetical protein
LWYTTPCRPLKVNRRVVVTCLYLQDLSMKQARNQREAGKKHSGCSTCLKSSKNAFELSVQRNETRLIEVNSTQHMCTEYRVSSSPETTRSKSLFVCGNPTSLTEVVCIFAGFWSAPRPSYWQHLEAIPLTGRGRLKCCEMSRIPHCLDNRFTDGGKVVSLTHLQRSTPQKHYFSASDTRFCWRMNKPQDLVRLEGLGKLKQN